MACVFVHASKQIKLQSKGENYMYIYIYNTKHYHQWNIMQTHPHSTHEYLTHSTYMNVYNRHECVFAYYSIFICVVCKRKYQRSRPALAIQIPVTWLCPRILQNTELRRRRSLNWITHIFACYFILCFFFLCSFVSV